MVNSLVDMQGNKEEVLITTVAVTVILEEAEANILMDQMAALMVSSNNRDTDFNINSRSQVRGFIDLNNSNIINNPNTKRIHPMEVPMARSGSSQ